MAEGVAGYGIPEVEAVTRPKSLEIPRVLLPAPGGKAQTMPLR